MYLDHFGLTEFPFGITPDTSFIYAGTAHQEALNTLLVAIENGEGFIKITGEIGTGKTLLCRRFVAQMEKAGAHVAYIPNPQLEPQTLLLAIAEELGIVLPASDDAGYHLIKAINQVLLERVMAGKRVVVCLDEAQAIPLPTLECVRLLSNLETEKDKLLQLVFFGQPELDQHLAAPAVRQLRQRIAFEYRLQGLSRLEVGQYLAHRLRCAGCRQDVFTTAAIRRLHKASGGTPRVVNILAHKALLVAFGAGLQHVTGHHVLIAAKDSAGFARRIGWWS